MRGAEQRRIAGVISILRQNEDAQFQIAKELLAMGSLTGAQVRSIVIMTSS